MMTGRGKWVAIGLGLVVAIGVWIYLARGPGRPGQLSPGRFVPLAAELEGILNGTLNKSLIDLLDPHTQACLKRVDDLSVKEIYNFKSVVEIEIAGFNVIGELLEQFVGAVLKPKQPKSQKLLKII